MAVGGELLAEADGGRVLEMGAAGLEHAVERLGPAGEGGAEPVQRRQQIREQPQRAKPDGRGDHVVGGLGHVDVIVGLDRRVLPAAAAEQLVGAVGEDLVAIHVVRSAGAGLIGVHDKLVPVLAGEHFIGGADDGVGELGLEPPRLLVRERRRLLDEHDGVHERRQRRLVGDGEVAASPLGLDAVERRLGDGQLAERVFLEAGAHGVGPITQHAVGREPGIVHRRETS